MGKTPSRLTIAPVDDHFCVGHGLVSSYCTNTVVIETLDKTDLNEQLIWGFQINQKHWNLDLRNLTSKIIHP